MDCIVEPHEEQERVDSSLTATQSTNRPEGCEQPLFSSGVVQAPVDATTVILWLMIAASALAVSRRGARQPRGLL